MTLRPTGPAETYENYFVPAMFRPWANILLQHATLRPGERVLDVASGTGVVAREAAARVGDQGRVSAVDISPAMLDVARGLPVPTGAEIDWQTGEASALPFADASFDVALCQHGLQFFSDRLAAAREMRRVLVAGGRALAIVLRGLALHPVFEAVMSATARQLSVPLHTVSIPFALHDPAELRRPFLDAGFADVEIREVSLPVRFPEPERFVPLAVTSSAAAVPAFAALEGPTRAALVAAIGLDVEPVLRQYRSADFVHFPMFAQLAIAKM